MKFVAKFFIPLPYHCVMNENGTVNGRFFADFKNVRIVDSLYKAVLVLLP